MNRLFTNLSLTIVLCSLLPGMGWAQIPSGFVNEQYITGWNQAVGMVFDGNRMYVWEKAGKIWIVENGVRLATPLLDISEEVATYGDYGLLSVALDPSFSSNGLIYLYYVVDRHHLLYHGTPSYNPLANEFYNATIGRITRYKALAATNFTTVDPASRTILLGESISTGIPILHTSHGVGTLLFGKDGTLLASAGDGASFEGLDIGGAGPNTYTIQGLADGIITTQEDVGSFRSQQLISHNGKILRLDPATGNGITSNPFYDANNPRSAQSRTWAMGLRNPSRMTIKPETGSHNPADANPGVLYIGDVGWKTWEEMNICITGGTNFGWPLYEGMYINSEYDASDLQNPEAPAPGGCGLTYYRFEDLLKDGGAVAATFPDPCNPGQQINGATYNLFQHTKPTFDWHQTAGITRASVGGLAYDVGAGPVSGTPFLGNASIGGVWYLGDHYPAQFQNAYFHGEYGQSWIRIFNFDANHVPQSISNEVFNNMGRVVFLAYNPADETIYYIQYTKTVGNNVVIKKLAYYPGNLPPIAVATSNVYYGASNSLNVSFNGSQSSDPEGGALIYTWNFGDGTPNSSAVSPNHTFTAPAGVPTSYDVTLTVTDNNGLSNSALITIYLNNTPPVISATSLDAISEYVITGPTLLNLSATVSDAEHPNNTLTYAWQTVLHHNDHTHLEPVDNNPTTTTSLTPIGCDGVTYFYRVYLTVTDPEGLSTTVYRELIPHCIPITVGDESNYFLGQALELNVLGNDFSEDGFDYNSFTIVTPPSHGSITYNAGTGKVTYTQDGSVSSTDFFTYKIADTDGEFSAPTSVDLTWIGPPTLMITRPLEGKKVDNKFLPIHYTISGDTTLPHHITMVMDNGTPISEYGFDGRYNMYNVALGAHTLRMHLVTNTNAILPFPSASDTVNFTTIEVGRKAKIRTGLVTGVSSSSWKTVTLDTTYANNKMVVVGTVVLNSPSDLPAVVRIQNASGSNFQIKVQNPSGANLSNYKVYYIVAEAGTYTEATDGIKMEAVRATAKSTKVGNTSNWSTTKDLRAYANTYATPVVLHQIMTNNNAGWVSSWSSSNEYGEVPSPTKLFCGMQVAEDPNTTRVNETIGMIIFESGYHVSQGRPIATSVIPDGLVYGVQNSTSGFDGLVNEVTTPTAAVLSQGGMKDIDGSWAVMMGSNPLNTNSVRMALDEDDIADAERSHGSEQVSMFVIDSVKTAPVAPFPVEWLGFSAKPTEAGVHLEWLTASEVNTDYFAVERAKDARFFEEIGQVSAAGNSQTVKRYETMDLRPLAGLSYYRLRQVDKDGTFSYSAIAEVWIQDQVAVVYPNPVTREDQLMIDLFLPAKAQVMIEMTNAAGQVVLTREHTMARKEERVILETAGLSNGVYFLRMTSGETQVAETIVINKD
ncbi:MAG: PQQ-dependent sugar dehydrogenase [Bacteroidia bacterium]|nr:PQQ-dependent sugar dehydrogenase [Bacteroidia bacterium]